MGWASQPRPTQPGSQPPSSVMLIVSSVTFPLLHVAPWRHFLHGLDRDPCRASFSIYCSGPRCFTACPLVLGSFEVMFTSCLDLCQAS
jgi:hypothetical protein